MNTPDAAPFRSMNMARSRMPSVVPLQTFFETIDGKGELVGPAVPLFVVSAEGKRGSEASFAEASSFKGMSHQKQQQQQLQQQSSQSPSQAENRISSSICDCPWRVSNLPLVPVDIPLEPTALEVQGISSTQITSRIYAFMKVNSICCSYHGNEARVDCKTFCGLKFVVQLFRRRMEQQQDQSTPVPSVTTATAISDPIVMEVQRRRGCCIVMRTVRTMLYRSVLKNSVANAKKAWEECSKHQQRQCWKGSSRSTSISPTFDTEPRCLDLLASRRKDCNRFGMDLLLVLVNPDCVGRDKAEEIAHALAFGTGPLGERLRMVLLSVIDISRQRQGGVDDDGLDIQNVSTLKCPTSSDSEVQHLRLLCVQILSTSLDIIIEKEQDYLCNEANLLDLGSKFWSRIVSFFLFQLDDCARSQHEAALAAKCLRILESLHPGLLIPATKYKVVSKAIKAYTVGRNHHLLLEQEADKLLKCLNLKSNVSTMEKML
jgi:hypothetical protein